MISGGELARRAGVTRQAVSNLTRDGILSRIADTKGNLGYDETSPVIIEYINRQASQRLAAHDSGDAPAPATPSQAVKSPVPAKPRQDSAPEEKAERPEGRARANDGDEEDLGENDDAVEAGLDGLDKNELDRHKVREQIIHARIQNKVEREKYVPCDEVRRVFSQLYSVHTSILQPLGAKLSSQIAAEFGVTDTTAAVRVQEIIDKEVYQALHMIKEQLLGWLDKEPIEK
jgi:hypothetical protein